VFKVATGNGAGRARWSTSDDPRHWNSWRREYLAYTSGFAEGVYADAGIRAPGLIHAEERTDGTVALWLEDVAGTPGTALDIAELADFVRRLGAAQAGWAGELVPTPWLSRRWLRGYLDAYAAEFPDDAEIAWDHDAVVKAWPERLRMDLRALWEGRETALAIAESSPQTLCHLDIWPMNLIAAVPGGGSAARDSRFVLLDWSFVGQGALGEDVGNMIVDSVADGLIDPALLPEIAATLPDAYLDGLREGGWSGSSGAVRLAIAATGAAKYSWLAPGLLRRLAAGPPAVALSYDARSFEETFDQRLALLELIAQWARIVAVM
jgi:hypothetical protein